MVRALLATLRLRMPARTPLAAALAALALVAAGCTSAGTSSSSSSKDFKGEQKLVANTIDDLSSAAGKGDQDTICASLLAADVVKRLDARGGCRNVVDSALKDADTSDVAVDSVTVNGTTADARVKSKIGSHDRFSTVRLVKQAGRWKISSLS
jgi:hypothetical protein